MSTIITAAAVNILAAVLPLTGIEIGTEQLTTFVQTSLLIGSAGVIWIQRWRKGDVTFFGARKYRHN